MYLKFKFLRNLKFTRKISVYYQIISDFRRDLEQVVNQLFKLPFSVHNLIIQVSEVVSKCKFNILGALKMSKEKPQNSDGKTGHFTQNQFSTKLIFFYIIITKNESLVIYTRLSFQNILAFLAISRQLKFEICQSRKNLQINVKYIYNYLCYRENSKSHYGKNGICLLIGFDRYVFTKSSNDNDLSSNKIFFVFIQKVHLKYSFLFTFLKYSKIEYKVPLWFTIIIKEVFGSLKHKPPLSPPSGKYTIAYNSSLFRIVFRI
ncbi:hypothetical protein AGLY_009092 [Aphis glycines]|uniref:Uncharacterized protein n=1 Tax=Aphis glycines TaxID=307491 RepID=A0A6G0TKH8_APHGL|nr:hypothetical protein AGLY_009092 [Aphis glycines]